MHLLDVRARRLADPPALGGVGDERLQVRAQVSFVALTIGTRVPSSSRSARRPHRGGSHDRLPERHALDREEPVPAGVELVDDDVGLAIALERLVVVEALDEDEVGVEPLARGEHVLGPLAAARRGRVQDHRSRALGGR